MIQSRNSKVGSVPVYPKKYPYEDSVGSFLDSSPIGEAMGGKVGISYFMGPNVHFDRPIIDSNLPIIFRIPRFLVKSVIGNLKLLSRNFRFGTSIAQKNSVPIPKPTLCLFGLAA